MGLNNPFTTFYCYLSIYILSILLLFINIMSLRTILTRSNLKSILVTRCMSGEAGSGAGKGGGSGGSIKDAGGAFGKMEVAQEEQYFRKDNMAKTKALKSDLQKEAEFHEAKIKEHQEALDKVKSQL